MRVQLWSYNYAPEATGIAPVSEVWAKAMRELGHDIDVVAAFPHYPEPRWEHPRRPYREVRRRHPRHPAAAVGGPRQRGAAHPPGAELRGRADGRDPRAAQAGCHGGRLAVVPGAGAGHRQRAAAAHPMAALAARHPARRRRRDRTRRRRARAACRQGARAARVPRGRRDRGAVAGVHAQPRSQGRAAREDRADLRPRDPHAKRGRAQRIERLERSQRASQRIERPHRTPQHGQHRLLAGPGRGRPRLRERA